MEKNHLISIVGAGPGSPDLLTVIASRRIQEADVVLYDALPGNEILGLAVKATEKIYAGKHYQDGQQQNERQEKINISLKQFAIEGKKVVRLKAGDPFIFGRGTEELEFCLNEGLNVEVIPGISAGPAAAAAFNIPVTLRGLNSMVLYYTGHNRNGGFDEIEVVAAVLKTNAPVFIYMGLKNISSLAEGLMRNGVPATTPLQIISCVGHPGQQIFSSSVAEVNLLLESIDPPLPSVIIIGSYSKPWTSRN